MKQNKEQDASSLVELLMDFEFTEVKARIYAYLKKVGKATAEGISKGAGIYISSVREAIAEMYHEGLVKRGKMEKKGLGKPAYIYEAISPQILVRKLTRNVKEKLAKLSKVLSSI